MKVISRGKQLQGGLTLLDVLRAMWRRKILVTICILSGAGIATWFALHKVDRYSYTAVMQLSAVKHRHEDRVVYQRRDIRNKILRKIIPQAIDDYRASIPGESHEYVFIVSVPSRSYRLTLEARDELKYEKAYAAILASATRQSIDDQNTALRDIINEPRADDDHMEIVQTSHLEHEFKRSANPVGIRTSEVIFLGVFAGIMLGLVLSVVGGLSPVEKELGLADSDQAPAR